MVSSSSSLSVADCGPHSSYPPRGIKVVVGFFAFHLLLVIFPAWSFFQYNLVATTFHLEEPRSITDEAVVQTNRAIGWTNLVLVIPLNLLAILGLLKGRHCTWGDNSQGLKPQQQYSNTTTPPIWAMACSFLLLGNALNWPILYLASRWTYASADIDHVPLQGSDVGVLTIVLALALWSTWYLTSYYSSNVVTTVGNFAHHPLEEDQSSLLIYGSTTTNVLYPREEAS
jgi:hypothetical protein